MQRGERRKERFIPSYLKFRKSSPPSQRWLARCLNLTFLSWQKFMLNKVSPPAQPPRERSSCLFCLHYNLLYIASFQKLSHYTLCRLISCQNLLSGSKIFITSFNMAFFLNSWSPFRPFEENERRWLFRPTFATFLLIIFGSKILAGDRFMNLCVGQKEIFPIVRGYLLWKTALSDWGGGSKEGRGSAGDTQGWDDAASLLACWST